MRWHPRAKHFVLMLAVVTALPVLTLGLWQGRRFEAQARRDTDRELTTASANVAHDISMLLRFRLEELELLATRASHLERWTETEQVRGLFDRRYGATGFSIMYLGDPWGTALFASPARSPEGQSYAGVNYADRAFYQRMIAARRSVVGDVTIGRRTGQLQVAAAAPVFHREGALRGFVTGAIHMEPLVELAVANARGHLRRVVVVDSRHNVVIDSAAQLAPMSQWIPLDAPGDTRLVRAPVTREVLRMAGAVVEVPGGSWRAFVSVPEAQVAHSTTVLRRATLLATMLVLMVMVGAVYAISSFASRDLRKLATIATLIGEGDYQRGARTAGRFAPREVVEVWESMQRAMQQLEDRRSERSEMIRELQDTNTHLRTFSTGIRDAHDGVVVFDRRHRVEYANPAWLRMHQLTEGEVLGRRLEELNLSDGRVPHELRAALRDQTPWEGAMVFRRKDGTSAEAEVSVSPVYGDAGDVEHHVALVRDVTARRQAEQSMQQTERLASLGMLAAGVAHEINNPMTYVLGNLEELRMLAGGGLLTAAPEAELELVECLDDCLHGARRVVEIVGDLRQLSQLRRESAAETANGREVIESCLRVAHSQLRHCADVVRQFPQEELWLRISTQHLGQVVLNLIMNAAQAMDPGQAAHNRLTVTLRATSPARAELMVTDTGSGMAPELTHKIFDPFFTTKRAGLGTGLGLSICRSLVTAAQGEILVESTPGAGSTFRVLLPLAPPPSSDEGSFVATPSGLSVLVVDDDPSVLAAVQRMLAPCVSQAAASVDQALELVTRSHFDLVLTDVMMPEKTGVDLIHELTRVAPHLARRTCLMSGGVMGARMAAEIAMLQVPFLHKPMTRDELHRALRALHHDHPPATSSQVPP